MNDIVPELLEKIQKQFQEDLKNNPKIKNILLKQKRETIDYTDSLEFAKEIGNILKDSLKENISEELLPDGKMYYNIAQRILEPTIKNNFDIIADQCEKTQNILNKKAKIGIQSAKIDYNEEKTRSIIDYISNAKSYSQREKSFLSAIVTNAKSIVDDSVKNNADLHYKTGLNPKIIRTARGKTCKWCQAVAGIYDYKDVKNTGNDVFRRHANCDCTVIYDPGDGSKAQNVWNKKIEYKPNKEEIEKRIEKSTKNEKMSQARQDLLKLNVKHNPVIDYRIQPTEEKIVKDLSGGDLTKGSCSSLAFAYIGNKSGYQVLDFRGGESRSYFSTTGIREIAKLDGVISFIERDYSDFKAINRLLEHVEEDKEYYFATGNHAAIIKKTSEGYKYLELQSGNPKQNGFHDLTNKELRYRFNCKNSHRLFGRKIEPQNFLIDAESLYNNDEFKKIMGFINTAFESQQKGANGHVK